jgi:hypothetical protein
MISQSFINKLSILYICCVVLVSVVAFVLVNSSMPTVIPEKNLTDAAAKAVVLATDMIKLTISLATGLIAVCVWLLTRRLTADRELIERLVWSCSSILALSSSVYFGFVALDGTLYLLSNSTFDARAALVWRPQTFQYYAFVAGALLLGFACLRSINSIVEME